MRTRLSGVRTRRFIGAAVLGMGLLASSGCTTRTVQGRVIEGRASIATVADPKEDRLVSEEDGGPAGVGGIEVRAFTDRGGILDSATSGSDGRFRLRVPVRFSNRARVEAEGEGYLKCSSVLFLPADGRRVLVVLEPLSGGR
ncbi:MAG: hypothetical protein AAGB51_04090 [Planctomycetota bacterium]